ncbi:hypothetical protein [Rhodococcus sp. 008]|uniref:hypothetical protein n=1 Tax=Rhodococcus sp. 008 TaxID=1723645 RepID=UPI0012E9EDEF|nr:hypothetical protein [Rhodococcus sp. 008]
MSENIETPWMNVSEAAAYMRRQEVPSNVDRMSYETEFTKLPGRVCAECDADLVVERRRFSRGWNQRGTPDLVREVAARCPNECEQSS